jgi:hypothetical protein
MNDLEKAIYGLEFSLLRPATRSSRSQLDSLLHEDFQEFGSSGKTYSKKEILKRLPISESPVFEISDFKLKELTPDFVLTTFITTRTESNSEPAKSL